MSERIHKVKFGNTERVTFSKIKEVIDIPYLIEVQRNSYKNFVEEGIREVFDEYSPIVGSSGRYELEFLDYTFGDKKFVKKSEPKCRLSLSQQCVNCGYRCSDCKKEGSAFSQYEKIDLKCGDLCKSCRNYGAECASCKAIKGDKTAFTRFEDKSSYYSYGGNPKYNVKQCKDRDTTYALPLVVTARLTDTVSGEVITHPVFLGDFPLMTDSGSFIINGAERVIVSQMYKSPSVYCVAQLDKNGIPRYKTTVSPNRGAWLEFEQDASDIQWVHVDRTRKITATTLIRALGIGTDEEILEKFGDDEMLRATCNKDVSCKTSDQGKVDLFKRLRPGEVPTAEGAETALFRAFFDKRRYELARVGRYKYNKKLAVENRIFGYTAAQDIVSPLTGEILVNKGEVISKEKAKEVQNNAVNEVFLFYTDSKGEERSFKVIGNNTVDLDAFVQCNPRDLGIMEKVYYPTLKNILDSLTDEDEIHAAIRDMKEELVYNRITPDDIFAAVSYNLGLRYGFGTTDNIDHLSNRRVRAVGELLQNQFRIGISRLERGIKEKMSVVQEASEVTPQSLINIRPVISAIKEFFGSNQLSQFMDQPNPIAELTHKRKLSALGRGGLNRDRAGVEVRDVHHSHYGRICPIETPEGSNIGLISSISTYARVNEYGFIESPYRKINKATGEITDEVVYMTADEEDNYIVAQANEPLDEHNKFINPRVNCRFRADIREFEKREVDYMDVNPKQLVSIATALIPFLENDDTNRALMGSNMQRQAVPLLRPQEPIIATGVEHKIAYDSGVMIIAKNDGVVSYVSADKIIVERSGKTAADDDRFDEYVLSKFQRSNQSTCINQHPIVNKGDVVAKGTVLADGPATANGELALGRNILVAFMSWEGYNYEDAILISEDLVKDDVFTSIHIEEYEIEARDTKLGDEQITSDIPNLSDEALKNLDQDGVIRVGAEVHSGDILVGKVTPKGETELTPEERLLRAIFGEKAREVRDTSLRVPHGEGGIVVDVKTFTRKNKDELSPGVNKLVRVYIAQKRKISVGDKMAGRHGNKGVISRVLPREDMPFLEDGTPLQIVLNPLGVPSRMNIGQVLEVHLGLIAKQLGWKIATPVFDGATEQDIKKLFCDHGLPENGKIQLYDGRTGEPFENPVTVGYMYMLKLAHLVDDKIHARSTGPYSLVTQQPLGGKAQFGGQRFGEMEVWALEAYGAANILQEILTVKSDDVVGRVKTYDSIVKGNSLSEPGIPESFKVLIKELQSLALDVKVLTENHDEISIRDMIDDDGEIESAAIKKETEVKEIDIMGSDDLFGAAKSDDDGMFGSSGSIFDDAEDDDDASRLFGTAGLFDDDDDNDDN